MADTNSHERAARALKAMKLIAAVSGFAARHKLTALEVAEHADPSDIELFGKLAQTPLPSRETWSLVVAALREAQSLAETAR